MSTHAAGTRVTPLTQRVLPHVRVMLLTVLHVLEFTSRPAYGRHAWREARAPLWPELVLHYVVAAMTWTQHNGDDDSALDRCTRVYVALVTAMLGLVALLGLITLLGPMLL